MVSRVRELLKKQEEFTLVAAFKQQETNSGSIISITSHDTRVFELESSGRRDELRLHYTHRGRLRTETFPYKLADNQWHVVAMSFSSVYVEVFIDCKKVYERSIAAITVFDQERSMRRMSIWLGQRDAFHAYFKGAIEYISFIGEPNGILEVCPHANIACPTCSQFRQLTHSIKQMYDYIQVLNTKLSEAEQRISDLEQCDCQLSCTVAGTSYRNEDTWRQDDCTTCTCRNGVVDCRSQAPSCPLANCSNPYKVRGQCCLTCGKHCYVKDVRYDDGQSYCAGRQSATTLVKCTCREGSPSCEEVTCPKPSCPPEDQFEVADDCCRKCKHVKFCERGHNCHQNATCYDLETKYSCQCDHGFEGNGRHCEDVDECARYGGTRGNYCGANTHCVNTVGSFTCQCERGFVRQSGTDLLCQEHDECSTGAHSCDPHADCINSHGSYKCTCKRGYQGDGFTCSAICKDKCQNGGVCVSPNVCRCRKGFIGRTCDEDLDECKFHMDQCHVHSECVNMPAGYYCQCKQGFYSNKDDNLHGRLCHDENECGGWGGGFNCPEGTTCENTEGSYVCRCNTGSGTCSGCEDHNRWHDNGTTWRSRHHRCTLNRCVSGVVHAEDVQCDCAADNVDLACCPRCRVVGQCRFNGRTYPNEHRWVHQCQHCQCLDGEVDCWAMHCPRLACNMTLTLAGDCCPRCAGQEDPCQAVNEGSFLAQLSQSCAFNRSNYATGHTWTLMAEGCTTCECKGGHVCCQYNQHDCDRRPAHRGGARYHRTRKRMRNRASERVSRRRRTAARG